MNNNIRPGGQNNNISPAKQMLVEHEQQIIYYAQRALEDIKSLIKSKHFKIEDRNTLDDVSDNLASIISTSKTFIEMLKFTN